MAVFNEVLVGRYNRLCQKLLSMKGPASLTQLRGEMGIELPLFHGSENRYLEAWDLFGIFRTNAAPGVGNSVTFVIRNPAGSNVIAVVTRANSWETSSPALGSTLTLFRAGAAGATADENTIVAAQGWDGRGRPSSTCVISVNTAAQVARVGGIAISSPTQSAGNQVAEQLRSGDEIPLTPGTLLTLSANSTNEATNTLFWWRERFLEDSERT